MCEVIIQTEAPSAMETALLAARHSLATLHGLWVMDLRIADRYSQDCDDGHDAYTSLESYSEDQWQIDEDATLAQIDAALRPAAGGEGGA